MSDLTDMLSGTVPDERRKLCKWYSRMTDAQRIVVAGHQKDLMRRRRSRLGLADMDTFAYAMHILALYQLRHAEESSGRKRSLRADEFALVEKLRRAKEIKRRVKKRGKGEEAEEFIRANFEMLAQKKKSVSLDQILAHLKENYGKSFARSTFYKSFNKVTKNMEDWEETDNAKSQVFRS